MGSTLRTLLKLASLVAVLLLHLPLATWALLTARRRRVVPAARRLLVVAPFPPGNESGGARAVKDFLDMLRRQHEPALAVVAAGPSSLRQRVGRLLMWPLSLPISTQALATDHAALWAPMRAADVTIFEFFSTATAVYLAHAPTPRVVLRDHEVLVRKIAMEAAASAGLTRAATLVRLAICYLVSRAVYARVDQIVTLTEEDRVALLAWFPHLAARTVAVPVPFDEPVPDGLAAAGSGRDLLMIGNFFHRPNVDALLWFVQECAPHLGPGFTLHICGLDRPLDSVDLSGAPLTIHRHGFVDDIAAAVPHADIAVAPVVSGGGVRMKNLLLASMAKAIVTTPLGNEGIGFSPGRDAMVCGDGPAMAAALTGLAADPAARARMGQAAREFVSLHFSPAAVLARLERDVLQGGARPPAGSA